MKVKMKKLVCSAVACTCAFLLFPMFASAQSQGGLQTDTDGTVTGTSGTKYLWVNAANFPDDEFRKYLLSAHASTAAGGSYVIPENITKMELKNCCRYAVGQTLRSTWNYCNVSDLSSEDQATVNAFFNDQTIRDGLWQQAADDGYGPGNGDFDFSMSVRKNEKDIVSSVDVVNGEHHIYRTQTVEYVATLELIMNEAEAWSATLTFDGARNEDLYASHRIFITGNVSDLTGISYFSNLKMLNCIGQQLTSLNLNSLPELRRLSCDNNQLTSLDLTALMKIDSLSCKNNRLTDLKVNLVAHAWWDKIRLSYDQSKDIAHQRVFLDCSNNFLSNLNNVVVTPSAVGQMVNIEGSYANNRILAFPLGNHPYYDTGNGIFAFFARDNFHNFSRFYVNSNVQMTDTQRTMFEGLSALDDVNNLYFHTYPNNEWLVRDFQLKENVPVMYSNSLQKIDVNLSVIDKMRSRVGVAVPDNLYDEENRFEEVALLDNAYPEKFKQGENTYYAYSHGSSSSADLDYCHATAPVSYRLFNGYASWIGQASHGDWGGHSSNPRVSDIFNLSELNINKYADWFDPNVNTYFNDEVYGYPYLYLGFLACDLIQVGDSYDHNVTLTADHYVMYVNPLSEDTEGKCNGTAVFDYDAIIPEGLEAFIVTGYTDGGESSRFKTGQLQLVKVGDGDGADGYKRVIPANNPVLLRTKQTVSEGQAADKMSTTGLYPFLNNNERTNYPCPDPNDVQYEPLETIPASLFADNILRGMLNTEGQDYTAGSVLTLGRYMDNGEKKIGFWTYNGAKLNMHRVYILKSDLNMSSDAKGCTLGYDDGAVITAIGGVNKDHETYDNTWYTLQGIRLSGKPTQSGVYIHNGQKVVVKNGETIMPSALLNTPAAVYTDNF